MSTLTTEWVPVPHLYTGAQITYAHKDYIVLDVLPQPIGGWVVTAIAVDDPGDHPMRYGLVYGNPAATAQMAHRALEVSR